VEIVAVSVGDSVNLNECQVRVHTVFKNTVNCKVDGGLISIVTPAVGSGPNNIVLNSSDLTFFSEYKHNLFNLNNINFSNAKIFDSEIILNEFDTNDFLSNLNLLERILIKEASPLSCAYMLDERRDGFFITPFEGHLRDHLRVSYSKFLNDGSLGEVKSFKGVGFGLTPQGDDLISGTLIAIYLYGLIEQISTENIRKTIYSLAKTENEISNSFLFYASLGKVYEKFKNLLDAVTYEKDKIYPSALGFLEIGETSGADVGTAFVLATKKFFNGGLPW
jgi:hypothetical protein